MATLQKFKLLGIQCGTSRSPTLSPSPRTSPLVQLRRRKTTLRMLLRRTRTPRRREPTLQREVLLDSSGKKGGDLVRRRSLKDLFGSSPPGKEDEEEEEDIKDENPSAANADLYGSGYGPGSPRPTWTGFRYRSLLSRKAWRPVLLTIDE